jgi:putative nucleotidyltransferase with HDIG domain
MMKFSNLNIYRTKKPFLLLLFFLAASAIVWILPKTPTFKQEYRIGAPWLHDDLYAPYDFPLYKTEAELSAEKRQLRAKAMPLFRLSVRSGALSLSSLMDQKQPNGWAMSSAEYRKVMEGIEVLLRDIYAKGIISEVDLAQVVTQKKDNIIVIRDENASQVSVSDLFTINSATAYILSQITVQHFDSNLKRAKAFVQAIDLNAYVKPNLDFDRKATAQFLNDKFNEISYSNGMISGGQKIVSKGEVVNDATFKMLESLKRENASRFSFSKNVYYLVAGQLLLVGGALALLYLFLMGYRREVLMGYRTAIFILLSIVGMVALVAWVVKMGTISIFIVPMTIAAMFIRTFYDSRVAFFSYNIIVLICAMVAPNSFEFVLMNYFPGVVAIFTMKQIYRSGGRIFVAVLVVFLTYLVSYLALSLIKDAVYDSQSAWNVLWLGVNALCVLIAYQFAYPIERLFGFLSDATLHELTDTNQPLLRELSELAPGTFQHSLQVANLAEAVAREVDGNPLLIRAGALYHDIGKMNNPGYFTENQSSSFNPHRNLEPDESAAIIIRHVTDGVNIARKHGLHHRIIRFIRTHHGTTKVNYFYRKYLENSKEQDAGEKFIYAGPRPESKEEAILMLADGVEAASHSLKVYTPDTIGQMVEDIVKMKMADGQLDRADISLSEITLVKEIFKRKLLTIYHTRVEYPK